uniref:Uncharacterized protein n=1 Tax=uncultured marine virus TaxID=186617 RepID=A0A0F7L6Q3_9VIRU|nr:hypothetical protein [uncultured marine virus]
MAGGMHPLPPARPEVCPMTTQEQWRLARLVQRVYAEGDMAVVLTLLAYDFRQWCNGREPSPVDPA